MGSLHRVRRLRHCRRSLLFLDYEQASRMSERENTYPDEERNAVTQPAAGPGGQHQISETTMINAAKHILGLLLAIFFLPFYLCVWIWLLVERRIYVRRIRKSA